MSDTLRNTINFPGLESPVTGTYTLQHGTRPGVAVIDCNPVDLEQIALSGTLELGDGNTSLYIPSCRLDRADLRRDPSGVHVRLYLLDRRWRWAYFTVGGHYNEPVPKVHDLRPIPKPGTQPGNQPTPADDPNVIGQLPAIQANTKKSARELGKLLFDKLGEKRYDVSALPDNDYPEKSWDVANVANELDTLCEQYGCRVAYNPMTNTAGVVRLGSGGDLPLPGPGEDGGLSVGLDPPEPPRKVVVYSAPIEYQVRFELEAVGLDLDGQVKLIDDLSYKPSKGWEFTGVPIAFVDNRPTQFARTVPTGYTWRDAMNAANQSVYRWFRIKNTLPIQTGFDSDAKAGQFWFPPESKDFQDKLKDRNQIELLPHLVTTTTDTFGETLVMPAKVYGITINGTANYQLTGIGDEVLTPFTVDADRQLIQFGHPMIGYKYVSAGLQHVLPATLALECSCRVRENTSREYRRFKFTYAPPRVKKGADGADELSLRHDDIHFYYAADYIHPPTSTFGVGNNLSKTKVNKTFTNKPDCEVRATYYAQAALARFQTKATATQNYNGIKLVFTDGVTQSVTWACGPVPYTVATANNEHPAIDVPYLNARRSAETSLARLREARMAVRSLRARIKVAKDYGYP